MGGETGSQPRGHGRGATRGAALVELALALPLLIMLVVGMVSAAVAYNHRLALTHAAREGGRYAATLPVSNFGSMDAWLQEVIDQVVDDATGTLDAGVPGRYVCVAYVHPDGIGPQDQTRRLELGSATSEALPCIANPPGDGRPDNERRVQVVARRNTDFSVVFFSSTITIGEEAINRFEASQ